MISDIDNALKSLEEPDRQLLLDQANNVKWDINFWNYFIYLYNYKY